MARTSKALAAFGLTAALVVASAGAASAQASKAGSFDCRNTPLSGYVTSATGGYTEHHHQNRSTGATKMLIDADGGYFTSSGYQYDAWVVVAADFINSADGSCH